MTACGLVGCGTVGSAVVRLWRDDRLRPAARLKTAAVRDVGKRRAVDLSGVRLTGDAFAVASDPEIAVVVEATGDTALGHALALECFRRGASFVTASKSLVARFGDELEERATGSGAGFRYEAAAGGALPVVALLRLRLSPGPIRGFQGVLNGTCNFILSRLEEGISFAAALGEARRRGFAEADSRKDTSGLDTAEKLVVLARLCGVRLPLESVPTAGIDGLAAEDVAFGRARGFALRLLARFGVRGERVVAQVSPVFLPVDAPLARGHDEENVIVLDGGPAGPVVLQGRGAGGDASGAAVLADVRETLRSPRTEACPVRAVTAVEPDEPDGLRHYLRFTGTDLRPLEVLGAAGVVLEGVARGGHGLQLLTRPVSASVLRATLAAVAQPAAVHVPLCDETSPAGDELAAAASF